MSVYLRTEFVPVSCGKEGCNQIFAMSRAFYDNTQRDEGWFCPSGHSRRWVGDTTEVKLQKAAAREQHLKDQLSAATRDAEATRTALLRDRARFANGVCPCCNRSFEAVARHIRSQHPDYDVTKIKPSERVTYSCSCGRSFETLHGLHIHQARGRRSGWDLPTTSRYSAHLTKVAT